MDRIARNLRHSVSGPSTEELEASFRSQGSSGTNSSGDRRRHQSIFDFLSLLRRGSRQAHEEPRLIPKISQVDGRMWVSVECSRSQTFENKHGNWPPMVCCSITNEQLARCPRVKSEAAHGYKHWFHLWAACAQMATHLQLLQLPMSCYSSTLGDQIQGFSEYK